MLYVTGICYHAELLQICHDDSANVGIYINVKAALAVLVCRAKEGLASSNTGQDAGTFAIPPSLTPPQAHN
jgi:hypothetical protein